MSVLACVRVECSIFPELYLLLFRCSFRAEQSRRGISRLVWVSTRCGAATKLLLHLPPSFRAEPIRFASLNNRRGESLGHLMREMTYNSPYVSLSSHFNNLAIYWTFSALVFTPPWIICVKGNFTGMYSSKPRCGFSSHHHHVTAAAVIKSCFMFSPLQNRRGNFG